MANALFKADVDYLISDRPWLKAEFNDLYDIGNRIRDIDDTLFIVRNTLQDRWEVHCTEHKPNTYAWAVPWRVLDARTVQLARESRVELIKGNPGDIVRKANERLAASKRRARRNDINSWARDMRSQFAKIDTG